MNTLADRISEALISAGKKQADLVRATGAKASSVANWVGGRTQNLKGENLTKVADCLGVDPVWLASGLGGMRPASWPFKTISKEIYLSLSEDARDGLELIVAASIKAMSIQSAK